MRFGFYAGETDKTIYIRLRDSTTGLAKTGLAFNSAGAVCSYVLPLAARAAITLATQTVTGAHSDGGFVEVDATNCKGLYRLDLPDAAIASGSFSVVSIEFDGTIEESILLEIDTQKVNATQFAGQTITAAAGVTLPSTVASPTNITAGTITTVTNLTNLPTIPNDWITAAGIAATALNGKGDWNIGKTGYSLTQSFPANFAALGINASGHVERVVLVDTTTTNTDMRGTDSAATAAALATAQTAIDAIPTNAELATALDPLPTAAENATAVFTTALTEAYRSAGAAGTLAQYIHEIIAHLGEFAIAGTTKTTKRLDGSTTAKTYTLNDATSPTSITETT